MDRGKKQRGDRMVMSEHVTSVLAPYLRIAIDNGPRGQMTSPRAGRRWA